MAAAKSMNLMLMLSPPSAELTKELVNRSANTALPRSAYEQPKADAPQPNQTVLRVPGTKSSPLAALSVRHALVVERAGTHVESRSSPGDLLSQPSLCERITTNDATESQYWKSLQKLYEHIRSNDIPDPATPLELGLCAPDYIDFLFATSARDETILLDDKVMMSLSPILYEPVRNADPNSKLAPFSQEDYSRETCKASLAQAVAAEIRPEVIEYGRFVQTHLAALPMKRKEMPPPPVVDLV